MINNQGNGRVPGGHGPETFKTASVAVCKSFMTCIMLNGANKDRYGGLKLKLENAQILGRNDFPKSWEDLMGILSYFKDETKTTNNNKLSNPDQVGFAENGGVVSQAKLAAAPTTVASGVNAI